MFIVEKEPPTKEDTMNKFDIQNHCEELNEENYTPNTDTIENIILDYCEGVYHLEFTKSDLPEIVQRIKKLVADNVVGEAEHLDDARNNIEYL